MYQFSKELEIMLINFLIETITKLRLICNKDILINSFKNM